MLMLSQFFFLIRGPSRHLLVSTVPLSYFAVPQSFSCSKVSQTWQGMACYFGLKCIQYHLSFKHLYVISVMFLFLRCMELVSILLQGAMWVFLISMTFQHIFFFTKYFSHAWFSISSKCFLVFSLHVFITP